MKEKEFKIFWEDLSKKTQKRLFKFLGNENGNYDVFPIQTIFKEQDEIPKLKQYNKSKK